MPKARGSRSIGSIPSAAGGAGAQTGGTPGAAGTAEEIRASREGTVTVGDQDSQQLDLAARLAERIRQMGPVDVSLHSATRRRMENTRVIFDPDNQGSARVESESGTIYQVDYTNDRCNCVHHRTSGGRCRHITAAHQALGRITEEMPSPETGSGQIAGAEQVTLAINDRQLADQQDEELRREIQQVEEDDGVFYSDNEEEFQQALERAGTVQHEFQYHNVLNGSRNTFGLEIEFVGGNPDAIARELHELGICAYGSRVHYHSPSIPGKWKLERDGSVSDSSGGGELVSPVLTDTPETWRTIEKICEVANRHGARVDSRCGGHVHMGMEPLDTARQRWKRFFRAIGGFEDVIYRLSGGSIGRIRSGYTHYARPFQERASYGERSRFMMNDIYDVQNLARDVSSGNRYYGINLTNIPESGRPNTVEFRYFNSSLDHRQLQANVKLANAIMVTSEKARTRDDVISENMRRRGEMLREQQIGPNNRSDHMAIKKFVDIFFPRKKDKDQILSVYARNEWA